jgi:ATP-dependent Clp protease adaptor protein ClpS
MAAFVLSQTEVLPDVDVQTKLKDAFEKVWAVIVWNDPVNLMSYVVHVFQTVLKMDRQQATKHMLEVHEKGKSLVAMETRERAEFLVHRLQHYGLQATMEPAD